MNRRHAKDSYFNCVCVCFSYTTVQDVNVSIPILHSSLFVNYSHVMLLIGKQETLKSETV